jgi:hypothetical protein
VRATLSAAVTGPTLAVLLTAGVATWRKGHFLLFVIGLFIPVLWLVGALIGPSPRVARDR